MVRQLLVFACLMLVVFGMVTITHAQDVPDIVYRALDDLSARVGTQLTLDNLSSWDWARQDFPSPALGCPQPGLRYPQVITNGYQITLEYNGVTYDYRGRGDSVFLCTPSGGAAPGPQLTPTRPASPIPAGTVVCSGGMPTRLAIGAEAKSIVDGAMNVRQYPNLTDAASVTGQLLPGGTFTVAEGPQCAENRTWWKINYQSRGGLVTGWVVEGDNAEYWLEPVGGVPAQPGPTQTPPAAPPGAVRQPITAQNANLARIYTLSLLADYADRVIFMPAPSPDALVLTGQGTLRYYVGDTVEPRALTPWHVGQLVRLVAVGGETGQVVRLATVEQNPTAPDNSLLYMAEITPTPTLTEKTGFQLPYLPNSLVFSADGTLLAASSGALVEGNGGLVPPNVVWVWDAVTGAQVTTLQLDTPAADLAFSSDGELLAVTSPDEGVYLWATATWTRLALLPCRPGFRNSSSLAFSPDASTLAVGTEDGTVILWDVVTAETRLAIPMPTADPVTFITYSPDGSVLATTGVQARNVLQSTGVYLWNAATGDRLAALGTINEPIVGLAFRADGELLISVGTQTWWAWAVFE